MRLVEEVELFSLIYTTLGSFTLSIEVATLLRFEELVSIVWMSRAIEGSH